MLYGSADRNQEGTNPHILSKKTSYSSVFQPLCTYQCQARGEGGCQATHGNLTVTHISRVGILIGHHAFDLSILYSRREVPVNHLFLLILTIIFRPGVGIILENVNIQCPTSPPPPLGLDTDRCVTKDSHC